jgi:hypothetical protein
MAKSLDEIGGDLAIEISSCLGIDSFSSLGILS